MIRNEIKSGHNWQHIHGLQKKAHARAIGRRRGSGQLRRCGIRKRQVIKRQGRRVVTHGRMDGAGGVGPKTAF